jgi:hypothetical protein
MSLKSGDFEFAETIKSQNRNNKIYYKLTNKPLIHPNFFRKTSQSSVYSNQSGEYYQYAKDKRN